MPIPESAKPTTPGSEEFAAYLEYNKVLRSWFVAFGVGGPALFLVNAQVGARLIEIGQLQWVAGLFLAGAGSQVLIALLNKISNWYVYSGANDSTYRSTCRYKGFNWILHQFWIDVVFDLITIGCFGLATWRLVTVFGRA